LSASGNNPDGGDITTLRFYQTAPHPCSYLSGRLATTVFMDPTQVLSTSLYSRLITAGFRRSGAHLYRPDCRHCNACISCRIRVRDFLMGKRFQRLWKRNADLQARRLDNLSDPVFFELYAHYINMRHRDGDMYPPSHEQFQSFLQAQTESTQFYGFYLGDRLVAVSVLDELDHALSAMYTYFDPDMDRRSLGSYVILWQIEKARRLHLPYVYLGYWIENCDKMRYKKDYQPLEVLVGERWLMLDPRVP